MECIKTEVIIDADLQELVPGFVTARKKDIQELQRHLLNADFDAIARISHTIKGIAAPYGFPTLEAYCRQLEIAAKSRDSEVARQCLDQISTYFNSYTH